MIGSSYGGYLASILTSLRPVRWLGLRAPALYQDQDWAVPKRQLDREELAAYRRRLVRPEENRAWVLARHSRRRAAGRIRARRVVPHPAIASYLGAFAKARSLTHRVIEGADHGLGRTSAPAGLHRAPDRWATEMVLGARQEESRPAEAPAVPVDPSLAVEPGEEILDELVLIARYAEWRYNRVSSNFVRLKRLAALGVANRCNDAVRHRTAKVEPLRGSIVSDLARE